MTPHNPRRRRSLYDLPGVDDTRRLIRHDETFNKDDLANWQHVQKCVTYKPCQITVDGKTISYFQMALDCD